MISAPERVQIGMIMTQKGCKIEHDISRNQLLVPQWAGKYKREKGNPFLKKREPLAEKKVI